MAEARGPGANLQAAGELQVEKVLHDVMEEAIGDRQIIPAAICLGIAGVDLQDDAAIVRGIMKRIGFKARVLVVNDALVALEAGIPGQPGVVIISGTGSIAYGRNRDNEAKCARSAAAKYRSTIAFARTGRVSASTSTPTGEPLATAIIVMWAEWARLNSRRGESVAFTSRGFPLA